MPIWKTDISLELLNQRGKNTMSEYVDIEFTDIGDDYLTARMPVNTHTKQSFGIMHGGASCVLAETVASNAANFCIDPTKKVAVGLSINTNHLRQAKDGIVIGVARPIHIGKTTQVWKIEIKDDADRLISTTTLTMAVLDRR